MTFIAYKRGIGLCGCHFSLSLIRWCFFCAFLDTNIRTYVSTRQHKGPPPPTIVILARSLAPTDDDNNNNTGLGRGGGGGKKKKACPSTGIRARLSCFALPPPTQLACPDPQVSAIQTGYRPFPRLSPSLLQQVKPRVKGSTPPSVVAATAVLGCPLSLLPSAQLGLQRRGVVLSACVHTYVNTPA